MKSFAIYTLGCKVNQVETEAITEELNQRGYENVAFSDCADVYIINTCSVTHVADRKSRAAIRRARRRNPNSLVVVTGCFAEVFSQEVLELPEVDLVVSNRDKEDLADSLGRYLEYGRQVGADAHSHGQLRPIKFTHRHHRTRGFVKIQDGCENFCSYCIVPYARGPIRSKAPQHVIDEISNLVNLGYKEIVLNGIHIGQYGKDLENWNIAALVEYILWQIPGSFRIRLGSIEPNDIDEHLLELISDPRVCRHLHVPMQSGSNLILQNMNRRYTAQQYAGLLNRINNRIPGIGLTADVMVGFPGEGDPEFNETLKVIEESPLSDLHVFRYSMRPGTLAAAMSGQVDEGDKNTRSQTLISAGRRKRNEFLQGLKGSRMVVLTEESTEDGMRGLSDNYVDIMIGQKCTENEFYQVETDIYDGRSIKGRVISPIKLN